MRMRLRRRLLRVLAPFAAGFGAAACVIGTSWKTVNRVEGPVLVSLTHAVLDGDKREDFDEYVFIVADAMERGNIPGLVGFRIRKELFGDEVWTMSAWESEEALADFVRSDVHRKAMRVGRPAIVRMKTRRLTVDGAEVPIGWDRAQAEFDGE
ncbi:MAG: antibiotic biosynthesis monooxygenase [Myxococcota bacterium]